MGNCLAQGAKTWAVDDGWDRVEVEAEAKAPPRVNGGGSTSTIVKIKLTKKQLEEMLGKTGINTDQKLPIELLLKHAVNRGYDKSSKVANWRPALLTIPEAAE
ncbi:hypothetical protein FCM35_KLT08752 [Carex littledalei]|uniref:Uncharacterized protein n=1 Tax=Carex littledalei TaxID=544730 RepID=A0A833QPB3_9POAL|nr:hypothetical protein FCM35_KLT08752 [Carex littledalei]